MYLVIIPIRRRLYFLLYPSRRSRFTDTVARNEFELNQLRSDNSTQKELIEKLESDLAAAVAGQNKHIDDDLSTLDMLGSVHETKLEGDTNSVFTIVLAQRDRLRLRVGVLEEELMTEKTKHGVLQSEIDKLKDDNVKLYGKIKFLQGYGSKAVETSIPLPEESNYSAQYEKRLDPFQRFGQAETQRGYARLPIHDRASLSIGKIFASMRFSSTTKDAFIMDAEIEEYAKSNDISEATMRTTWTSFTAHENIQTLSRHLETSEEFAIVLYRFAYFESCERDFQQDCVARFERHMKEHHPGMGING